MEAGKASPKVQLSREIGSDKNEGGIVKSIKRKASSKEVEGKVGAFS